MSPLEFTMNRIGQFKGNRWQCHSYICKQLQRELWWIFAPEQFETTGANSLNSIQRALYGSFIWQWCTWKHSTCPQRGRRRIDVVVVYQRLIIFKSLLRFLKFWRKRNDGVGSHWRKFIPRICIIRITWTTSRSHAIRGLPRAHFSGWRVSILTTPWTRTPNASVPLWPAAEDWPQSAYFRT
jgi:hypothetical protein